MPQKDLSIICVLTNKTIPHIRSIVDEAKELGVRILFSPVTLSDNHYLNLTAKDIEKYEEVITNILDNEWLNNNIENFASVTSIRNTIFLAMKGKQRHYSCRLGCSLIGISATGDIYPCHRFIGVEEFKIGNINQGIDLQSYKKYAGRFVDNMEVCASCWARYFCGGGCAHDSYTYENDVLKPSSNRCELTRCEVELGLKYYADAMQKGNLKTLETLKDIIVYK